MGYMVWFLQAGWRLDLTSLMIGIVIGAGLTLVIYRALPAILTLREQSVSRVRQTSAWMRAGVEHRFQVETAEYVQNRHFGGHLAKLEQIVVAPRLVGPRPELDPQATPELLSSHLHLLWPDLAGGIAAAPIPTLGLRQLLLQGRRVILAAPAGAGKSTILAYCAYLCATTTDTGSFTFLLPIMPVLVHLAELPLTAPEVVNDPVYPLAHALRQRSGPLTASGVGDLLTKKLAAGQLLLLLDGLDECGQSQQATALAWLGQLLARYGEIQVIVATAGQGYGALFQLQFVLSGLMPWHIAQAKQLGQLWGEASGWPRPPSLSHYWQPGRTPFEATLHLLYQPKTNEPPPTRLTELLELHLRAILPSSDGSAAWLTAATRELWQDMAYKLFIEGRLTISQAELENSVNALLTEYGIEARQASALHKATQQTPLLVKWPDGSLSFQNPLWRDFLAASRLAQNQEQALLQAHLRDFRWRDLLRFYTGRVGENGLTLWLIDPKSADPFREGLFQAAGWLPETLNDGSDWRRQTLVQLGQVGVRPNIPQILHYRAIAALAQTGEGGVQALLQQLTQRTDPYLRQAAVAAIARFGPEIALPILEKSINDDNLDVRRATVYALGWLADRATEKPMLTALLGRDDLLAQTVTESLAINGGEGWTILREATEDASLRVRRAAVLGLMLLDEYWAVALLEKMEIEDEEWAVKSAASVALEAIAIRNRPGQWQPQSAGQLTWLINWATREQQSVPEGDAAIPTLLEALKTAASPNIRVAAALTLGQIHLPAEMIEEVMVALRSSWQNDPDNQLKDAAFITLIQLHRAYG